MSETLIDTFYAIIMVKMQVAGIALVLTGFAALIIKNATDSTGFAALFVPALALGCLSGVHICKMAGVVLSTTKESNIIFTAGLGMVLAFMAMLIVVWLSGLFRDLARPLDLDGRTRDTDI